MAIESLHPFSVGGIYLFELTETPQAVLVEGAVRWCRQVSPTEIARPQYRAGVEFRRRRSRASRPVSIHLPRVGAPDPDPQRQILNLEAEIEDRIREAPDTQLAGEALLDLLSKDFERILILRVVETRLRAWLGRGPGLMPERLGKLDIDLNQASVMLHLWQGGAYFEGRLDPLPAHLQLLHCWKGQPDQECLVHPIRLGHRLIAVVYADAGDRPLDESHREHLRRGVDSLCGSLHRLILNHRKVGRRPAD